MPGRIKDLAHKYMAGYEFLKVKKEPLTTNLTEQIYFEVKAADKFEALCRIIDIEDNFYGLVFCRTKNDVDSVVTHLIDRGYDAESIHGDLSQAQRERTLGNFRKQRVNILIATDVAARGIDVINLTHVINYSLPQNPESYVHRIGRTGRAGNEGTAITFITPNEYNKLMFIQRFAKTDIKKSNIPKVNDIIKARKKKIYDDLTTILEDEIDTKYHNWAKKMLEDNNPTEILAAMLNYCFEEELNPDTYGEIKVIGAKGKQLDQQGKARLFVALGKKDKINAGKLVELIGRRVSIKSRHISDIQIMDKFSFITVPFEKAEKIVVSFKEKGRKPLITHAKKRKDNKH
jgi:ATP-dependent RNA helicase DeaD